MNMNTAVEKSPALDANIWHDLGATLLEGCRVVAFKGLSTELGRAPTLEQVQNRAMELGSVYILAIKDSMDKRNTDRARRAFDLAENLATIQHRFNQGGKIDE